MPEKKVYKLIEAVIVEKNKFFKVRIKKINLLTVIIYERLLDFEC